MAEVLMRCLCGQLSETTRLRDELPFEGIMCHCSMCRRVTGALTFTGIAIDKSKGEIMQRNLVKYPTSTRNIRYFCPTCGTHVGWYTTTSDQWYVCTGAIDEVKKGPQGSLELITGHEFVIDTVDGGLSWAFPDVPYYTENYDVPPAEDIESELAKVRASDTDNQNVLQAECYCGQVKLSVGRSDTESGKWKGLVCACRSCRLSVGQTLVPWLANVQYSKVTWRDGSPYDGGIREGMKRFQSSDRVYRDFCSKCGATIIYNSLDEPDTIDIAVGVLRAKDGALAKSFIHWDTSKVYYPEGTRDKVLVGIVEKNLKTLDSA